MKEMSINSTAYLYDWFFTLYTRSFDRRIVKVVWDIILLLGPAYVLSTGIGMFYCMQEKLLASQSYEGFNHLKEETSNIKLSELTKFVLELDFPEKDFWKKLSKIEISKNKK